MASTEAVTIEQQVIKELKKGNQSAFKALYERYSAKLYVNIRSMLQDEDTAQEILQEVFIKVWNYRERVDPQKSFHALLYKISQNLIYNYFRKHRRGADALSQFVDENAVYQHVDDVMNFKETSAVLNEAIDGLSPQRKLVFKLCKLEGKSYSEVGEMLGISNSTISDHIVKATRAIKTKLLLNDISV